MSCFCCFSERLVKKRKQSLSEYVEDLSKFGKKRKIDQVCKKRIFCHILVLIDGV